MIQLAISQLAEVINAQSLQNAGDFFTGISTDTRTIKPGNCFFAIAGENFDGHDYLKTAFENGAACAVVSKNITGNFDKPILKVDDTIKALGVLAKHYRNQAGFKVIAVTGSVGKTTTRSIIHHVLSSKYRLCQSPKNFNNHIGLPVTLLSADPADQIIVAELGTSSPGEIGYLTEIAQPDIAVVTNVYPAHLQGFGKLENIAIEKISISNGLKPQGTFFINADCHVLLDTCKTGGKNFKTFGKSIAQNIKTLARQDGKLCSSFDINRTQVTLPLTGMGNIENALAAWSVCSQLGLTIEDFANAIKTLPAISMRAELLQAGTVTLINDCYNANPGSMKNAVSILAELSAFENRRSVFVCGQMAELGDTSDQLHAELGRQIANAKINVLITIGKSAKIIAQAAKDNADYDIKIKSFDDTVSACNSLTDFINNYDIVLVKASRSGKLELATEKIKTAFSGQKI